MIQEKTAQERAAMHFKSAGLGDRSAREAARLLLENGVSFETAAVLGQRSDESGSATTAKIREAADRYSLATNGRRPAKTAYGRPLSEAQGALAAPKTPSLVKSSAAEIASTNPAPGKTFVRTEEAVIDGVRYKAVTEYQPMEKSTADTTATEAAAPARSAWGRKA